MNYLVADIGNTLTKICIINLKFKITKVYQIETAKLYSQIFLKNFFRKVLKNKIKNKILFSSVVPKVFNKIKSFHVNVNNIAKRKDLEEDNTFSKEIFLMSDHHKNIINL